MHCPMAYEGKEPYIFVSYAHKDSHTVLQIISDLQRRGFRVWYDSGIEPGTEWLEYIAEHLDGCTCFLAFMSTNAAQSAYCNREINFAIKRRKPSLVVYLEDNVPMSLGMQMQLDVLQAMFFRRHSTFSSFVQELSRSRLLIPCCGNVSTFVPNTAAPNETEPVYRRTKTLFDFLLDDISNSSKVDPMGDPIEIKPEMLAMNAEVIRETQPTDRTAGRGIPFRRRYNDVTMVAGFNYVAAVKKNGTVEVKGARGLKKVDNVSKWRDIIAVAAHSEHTLGLRSDGTVVAVGNKRLCAMDERIFAWKNIVEIATNGYHTVGLKDDGTVVASVTEGLFGEGKVSGWNSICSVAAGGYFTIGLKKNGTVVATGRNEFGACNVSHWKDIVAIAAGTSNTMGLKADGTVVVTGAANIKQADVSGWRDIVAISVGWGYAAGLRSDGTVVATRFQEVVSGWKNIVAVSAGGDCIVGLQADGILVTAGRADCISGMKNMCGIRTPVEMDLPKLR